MPQFREEGRWGMGLTCNGLGFHPVGFAMFTVTLCCRNWDKLQLDGLHGPHVDLWKFCLSGEVYILPYLCCNFNNLTFFNFPCISFYSSLISQRKYILHLRYFTELNKNVLLPFLIKKISAKDSLLHLVSLVTQFVDWWIESSVLWQKAHKFT